MESNQNEIYLRARLARDPRFDGLFFTGVKSTGIYCRSICPAPPAHEENVEYFKTAIAAANAGLRPCLRCRPDSAPQSPAWLGTQTTLNRAIALIEEAFSTGESIDLEALSDRLGITARYLRQLFKKYLGTSPKQYIIYKKLLFAKKLLHETNLGITHIALNAGFESVRNFNHQFQTQLGLTPTQTRTRTQNEAASTENGLTLFLNYRPPYNWDKMRGFLQTRAVEEMEWFDDDVIYNKTFCFEESRGYFSAQHMPEKNGFKVSFYFAEGSQVKNLYQLNSLVRRILDLDANIEQIEDTLKNAIPEEMELKSGLRVSGAGSDFEAINRAILGQQVSITQAVKLLSKLVHEYGEAEFVNGVKLRFFPHPHSLQEASIDILKMPGARKQAIRNVAEYFTNNKRVNLDDCLSLKGIGPWTVDYAKMRGLGNPNIFLATDLVVKNKLKALHEQSDTKQSFDDFFEIMKQDAQPWCSYLTFQLWHL
ncbi:DNA-3-methyladenine glycosylase 2 family protein [Shewanella sp. 202IG2-18]|uniref:DNA-3-methyladenine glycosylase 2 family protein n=1 Tax=Parashewanella hymeniacidonis TaxID=2807618 RepID=UPI001960388D|nr:AlkA N-terminal domain-containing protein [Parashewanella hymeniacidonis]MBM7073320.1 DNA-3-methyladenine glycosylase 2 family protein [Parashewanella hymeniacidonis]